MLINREGSQKDFKIEDEASRKHNTPVRDEEALGSSYPEVLYSWGLPAHPDSLNLLNTCSMTEGSEGRQTFSQMCRGGTVRLHGTHRVPKMTQGLPLSTESVHSGEDGTVPSVAGGQNCQQHASSDPG